MLSYRGFSAEQRWRGGMPREGVMVMQRICAFCYVRAGLRRKDEGLSFLSRR
jgi:hypothetical protein